MNVSFPLIFTILFLMTPALTRAQEPGQLWPPVEPYAQGYLPVSEIHQIYYERCGNPHGVPVFVLHGGPGGRTSPFTRRFCDPDFYQIIQHDQRGAGKSRPYADLRENTTWDLVEDIERLRIHCGVDSIVLFGGSWGTTLALAYAEKYPEHVRGIVLRGVFTATQEEIDHFYHGGLARFFPELEQQLLDSLPDPARRPLPEYLDELLRTADPELQARLVRVWTRFEDGASKIDPDSTHLRNLNRWLESNVPTSFALFESYYMAHHCFLEEGQLWRDIARIAHIPTWIVNGRFDVICPPVTAWKLSRQLKNARLNITFASGHAMDEPNNIKAQVLGFEWMKTQIGDRKETGAVK